MPPARRFRVDLAQCCNRRMIDGWLARVQRADNGLTDDEYKTLVLIGLERGNSFAREGR
jgi:hypothetical protein